MSTIEQTQTGIPTGTWKADTVHSRVAFEVPYAVATFSGEVPDFEAILEDGQLTGVARIESIQVKEENLQAHLLSPEFFDAERNPKLRFESTEIRRDGDAVVIPGELTLKGATTPVELRGTVAGPVTDGYGRTRVGFNLETTIDRTQFGINWNAPLPSGGNALADEVKLTADLQLVQED